MRCGSDLFTASKILPSQAVFAWERSSGWAPAVADRGYTLCHVTPTATPKRPILKLRLSQARTLIAKSFINIFSPSATVVRMFETCYRDASCSRARPALDLYSQLE